MVESQPSKLLVAGSIPVSRSRKPSTYKRHTAPVQHNAGRSFIPGTSPNGNGAKKISPGRIHRLPVFEGVDVLP